MKRLRAQIDNASTEHGLTEDGRRKIAKEMNVRLADVEEMEKRLFGGDHSLNATLNTDASEEWQNFLPDERPDPEDVVIGMKDAETRSAWLNQALKSLTDREQQNRANQIDRLRRSCSPFDIGKVYLTKK